MSNITNISDVLNSPDTVTTRIVDYHIDDTQYYLDNLAIPQQQFTQISPFRQDIWDKITFCHNGISAELNIKEDITPLESANLCVLMISSMHNSYFTDWISVIREKGLERHFIINDPNEVKIPEEIDDLCSMD